jgi:hypothetical protein
LFERVAGIEYKQDLRVVAPGELGKLLARQGVAYTVDGEVRVVEQHMNDVPPDAEATPTALFIHGGYWQALDRSFVSHCARGLLPIAACRWVRCFLPVRGPMRPWPPSCFRIWQQGWICKGRGAGRLLGRFARFLSRATGLSSVASRHLQEAFWVSGVK